ncbi:hypothetical protein A7J67_09205 [Achromobacter xylosoxidans]|nr:hypothetical protein A7J67_09205 [Achromobacter xylosoxidans]
MIAPIPPLKLTPVKLSANRFAAPGQAHPRQTFVPVFCMTKVNLADPGGGNMEERVQAPRLILMKRR